MGKAGEMTTSDRPDDRGAGQRPLTESLHPLAERLDSMTTSELVAAMNLEDRTVAEVVGTQLLPIARVVEEAVTRLKGGGGIHYFGAGTSGRLAVLDAAECPPTFGVPAELVQAHLAGFPEAVLASVEGAEDDVGMGERDACASVTKRDVAIGLAASGTTPYVRAAVRAARGAGAWTAAIACTAGSPLAAEVDQAIELPVGPEILAGSTRLKAGTAQKLTLNMISTGTFWRLGHVYRGRMVDVRPSNAKLRSRAAEIVSELTGREPSTAAAALAEGGRIKTAVVMLELALDRAGAERRLHEVGDDLASALAGPA